MEEKPDFLTDEQWKIELELRREEAEKRQRLYEDVLKDNPPLPPWLKYPEAGMIDMVWAMGGGQDYLENHVFNYLNNAPKEKVAAYKKKYPEPQGWKGWY